MNTLSNFSKIGERLLQDRREEAEGIREPD